SDILRPKRPRIADPTSGAKTTPARRLVCIVARGPWPVARGPWPVTRLTTDHGSRTTDHGSQLQDIRFVDVERFTVAEDRDDDGEAHRGFGGRDRHDD